MQKPTSEDIMATVCPLFFGICPFFGNGFGGNERGGKPKAVRLSAADVSAESVTETPVISNRGVEK